MVCESWCSDGGPIKKAYQSFQELRWVSQIKCEILFVIFSFGILLWALFAYHIYLISLSRYKDVINSWDTHQFTEIGYLEMSWENEKLQYQEAYKTYVLTVASFYSKFSDDNIDEYFWISKGASELKSLHKDQNDNDLSEEWKLASYHNYDNQDISEKKEILFNMYYPFMLNTIGTKVFGNPLIDSESTKHDFYDKTVVVEFEEKNWIMFPCRWKDGTELQISPFVDDNDFDFEKLITEYLEPKIREHIENIAKLSSWHEKNVNYANQYLLPVFDEDKAHFPKFFKDTSIEIESICFSIILKKTITSISDIRTQIKAAIFVLKTTRASDIINDKMLMSTTDITLWQTDYLFPYKVHSQSFCYWVRTWGLENIWSTTEFDIDTVENLQDCFDDKTKMAKFKSFKAFQSMTFKDEFFKNMNIFDNTNITISDTSINDPTSIYNLVRSIELDKINNKEASLQQTINHILTLNEQNYKVKKSVEPLAIINQVNFYYPITEWTLNFLFKNEGFNKFVSNNIATILYQCIINCIMYCVILLFLVMCVLCLFLQNFLAQLSRPWEKLSKDKLSKDPRNQVDLGYKRDVNSLISSPDAGKSNVNDNIEKEEEIDEFQNWIQIIDEMEKGDIALKQFRSQREEVNLKLELENFNKEFEEVKIFNIIAKEEKIEEFLEKDNFTTKNITKDCRVIKEDVFVKKSKVFTSWIEDVIKNQDNTHRENRVHYGMVHGDYSQNKQSEEIKNAYHELRKECHSKRKPWFGESSLQNPCCILYDDFKTIFKLQGHKKENDRNKPLDINNEIRRKMGSQVPKIQLNGNNSNSNDEMINVDY